MARNSRNCREFDGADPDARGLLHRFHFYTLGRTENLAETYWCGSVVVVVVELADGFPVVVVVDCVSVFL